MSANNNPVKDEEFALYLKQNYEYQLEDELLKTNYGKKIKALEKLGVGITFKDTVSKYVERFGFSFDNVGNVKVEETSIAELYEEDLAQVSKKIGIDVSGLEIKEISHIYAEVKNGENVSEEKILEQYTANSNMLSLKEICKKYDIPKSEYALDKNSMRQILLGCNVSKEDAEKYISKNEKITIDTYMETKEDVEFIRSLLKMDLCLREYNIEELNELVEEFESKIPQYKKSKLGKDLKFFVSSNGKISLTKAMQYFKKFEKEREFAGLSRKTGNFSKKESLEEGNDEKEFVEILLRTIKENDDVQIEQVIKIVKNLNIDVLDEKGNLDKNKVDKYGKEIYGESYDSNEIIEQSSLRGEAGLEFLDRVAESIEHGNTGKDFKDLDQVNQAKAKALKEEERICSKKEKVIFDVLNSQNPLNKDLYSNPENAKQLIILYCKFREDEILKNKRNKEDYKGFSKNSINNSGYNSNKISKIIEKYILMHKENFKEYIKPGKNELNADNIMKVLEEENLSINISANNYVFYNLIKNRIDKIDKLENENGKKLKEINQLLGKKEIDENEEKKLYNIAKSVPINAFSTEELEQLKEQNEEKFNEIFHRKKVERNVSQDNLSSIYFSAIRLIGKGLYVLPSMIINKEKRDEYIPKIKNHIENGKKRIIDLADDKKNESEINKTENKTEDKPENKLETKTEKSNKKEGIFSKISKLFGKNNVKLLNSREDFKLKRNSKDKSNSNEEQYDNFNKFNNELRYDKFSGDAREIVSKDENEAKTDNMVAKDYSEEEVK
jgi:hypothetical protein